MCVAEWFPCLVPVSATKSRHSFIFKWLWCFMPAYLLTEILSKDQKSEKTNWLTPVHPVKPLCVHAYALLSYVSPLKINYEMESQNAETWMIRWTWYTMPKTRHTAQKWHTIENRRNNSTVAGKLRTGEFRRSKVSLPECPWWQQLAHSD